MSIGLRLQRIDPVAAPLLLQVVLVINKVPYECIVPVLLWVERRYKTPDSTGWQVVKNRLTSLAPLLF